MTERDGPGLPEFMRRDGGRASSPVYVLRAAGGRFDPHDPRAHVAFNQAMLETLRQLEGFTPRPPALVKIHVGERGCTTRIDPAFAAGTLEYLRERGCGAAFFGDTTVVYSGPRGYHENGPDAAPYRELARAHGWDGEVPFVVLDRPATAAPGIVSFDIESVVQERSPGGRFSRFALAGGFAAAGTVVQHAHLTLHMLSHVALCVKGLTMGLSARAGKLAMHQSLFPCFDPERCVGCGICVESCPEGALALGEQDVPVLERAACVGCGECQALCPEGAVVQTPETITEWAKGMESLPFRMTDYVMGLMHGRWEDLVNVAHLYNVTPLCDCVEGAQKPICGDIGFLVGRNPFAVDRAARELLEARLVEEGHAEGIRCFHPDDRHGSTFAYAEERYGVVTRPELREIAVEIPS